MRSLLAKCIRLGRFSLRYGLIGWSGVLHFRTDTDGEQSTRSRGGMTLFDTKPSKQMIFHSSYEYNSDMWNTLHTDRFFTRPSKSTGEGNKWSDMVRHTGRGIKGRLGGINMNSQERYSSGRRLGRTRAAGPWMTVMPSMLSW